MGQPATGAEPTFFNPFAFFAANMIKKEPSPRNGRIYVTFEFPGASRTKSVHLVGDFNNWNETATPMQRKGRGDIWKVRIELNKGHEYQFRYLVDQTSWHNDWHADRYIPNIHGSDNSLIVV
jgi:1,4-alpha-glucan branching enzyme